MILFCVLRARRRRAEALQRLLDLDIAGTETSLHHLLPKLKGGARRGTVRLHQICHSAIHARYTEAEIVRFLASPEELQADPELARFVAWVRTKPDDLHAPTRRARGKTSKWR